jgi:hypothetical protein
MHANCVLECLPVYCLSRAISTRHRTRLRVAICYCRQKCWRGGLGTERHPVTIARHGRANSSVDRTDHSSSGSDDRRSHRPRSRLEFCYCRRKCWQGGLGTARHPTTVVRHNRNDKANSPDDRQHMRAECQGDSSGRLDGSNHEVRQDTCMILDQASSARLSEPSDEAPMVDDFDSHDSSSSSTRAISLTQFGPDLSQMEATSSDSSRMQSTSSSCSTSSEQSGSAASSSDLESPPDDGT